MSYKTSANVEALHRAVWRAAIRFYVYRTPKRNAQAVALLRRELTRYVRAVNGRKR